MNVNLTPNITGKNVNIIKGATQADLTNSVNNSKIYRDEAEEFSIVSEAKSVEASYSALNASISSTTASDKATIATTKANEANNSAINASASEAVCIAKATITTDKANIATAQSVIATDKANEASVSANTATTQAGIATTKASEASTSASNALTSENNADTSEANALIYRNQAESFANSINTGDIVHISGTETITGNKTFTGTVTLPSTTSIGTVSSTELGYLDGVTSGIQTQLNVKAPLASPALTGTPTAPTAAVGTNTTQLATTAYVKSEVTNETYTKAQVDSKLAEQLVGSIAELKLIDGSTVNKLEVLGYYTKGDGGDGTFYWDSTSTETDNGGTIIQSTGVATGRWKRVYSGVVNVKWFGAKGDGITDDTSAIQNTLDFSSTLSRITDLDNGVYLVDELVCRTGLNYYLQNGKILIHIITSGIRADSANNVVIRNLEFDGTLFGDHYDDTYGCYSIRGSANKWKIHDNVFSNIYGSGIRINGLSSIKRNTLTDVWGFNPTTDLPSGAYDNYGDGIHLLGLPSSGSIISNNKIITSKTGRGGIVIEFDPDNILIENNVVSGYDRGVHIELCGTIMINGNTVTDCNCCLLISTARAISKGNTYTQRAVPTGSYIYGAVWAYSNSEYSIYDSDVCTGANTTGDYGDRLGIYLSNGSSFSTIKNCKINNGANIAGGYKHNVIENIFNNGSIYKGEGASETNFINNIFNDAKLLLSTAKMNHVIGNTFNMSSISTVDYAVNIANQKGGVYLEDNILNIDILAGTVGFFSSYLGSWDRGRSYCNNNIVYIDSSKVFNLFQYSTTGSHQPFIVDKVNYRVNTDTNQIDILTFSSKYNGDGNTKDEFSGTSAPLSGTWRRGDIIKNTNPSAGGNIGWVCTAAGTPGTWKTFGTIST